MGANKNYKGRVCWIIILLKNFENRIRCCMDLKNEKNLWYNHSKFNKKVKHKCTDLENWPSRPPWTRRWQRCKRHPLRPWPWILWCRTYRKYHLVAVLCSWIRTPEVRSRPASVICDGMNFEVRLVTMASGVAVTDNLRVAHLDEFCVIHFDCDKKNCVLRFKTQTYLVRESPGRIEENTHIR